MTQEEKWKMIEGLKQGAELILKRKKRILQPGELIRADPQIFKYEKALKALARQYAGATYI